MKLWKPVAALLAALFLSGCALSPKTEAAFGFARDGYVKIAMANEKLRCTRPLSVVLVMADELGNDWLTAYVANCPNYQALMDRILGAVAREEGYSLAPPE